MRTIVLRVLVVATLITANTGEGAQAQQARGGTVQTVLTHLAFYRGWPSVFSALPVAKDVFDKRRR